MLLAIFILVMGVFLFIKNINVYNNHLIICRAIFDKRQAIIRTAYNHDDLTMLKELELIDYKDMECYAKTLFRLWDWGYTRILPKEKFEMIKRYIN